MTTRTDDEPGREAGPEKTAPECKSKDYGLGPEPAKGTPEWMEWIEDQSMIAAFDKDLD